MAFAAQRDTKSGIEEALLASFACHKLFPKLSEEDFVVVGVQVSRLSLLGMCTAILAGVIVASKYSTSPSVIGLGFAQYCSLLGYAAFPVGSFLAYSRGCALYLGDQELLGFSIVARDKARNAKADTVHVGLDKYRALAAALTKMFALMSLNPKIYAAIVCAAVVAGVGFANRPTHSPYGIKFNKGLQCKWGELLETRPARAEGNQQPSAVNGEILAAKVQRLAGEEPTNKPALAPHAKAMI
jgi:hypothetical protein